MRMLAAGLALALFAGSALAQTVVVENVGLEGPEAARYDAEGDRYVVSNFATRTDANDGFISLLNPDGSVANLRWIQGGRDGVELYEPRGLFVRGDTLYVADNTVVRMFDRATGAPKGAVAVPGAVTLNDLYVTESGRIYITDSGSNDRPVGAIYTIAPDRTVSVFAARDPALERPNGIAVTRDGLIVHGGRGVNLVFRYADGRIAREETLPIGRFDGIVALADGSILAATQDGQGVYRTPPGGLGEAVLVVKDIQRPAAIGFDTRRNRVITPQIALSSVTLTDLPR